MLVELATGQTVQLADEYAALGAWKRDNSAVACLTTTWDPEAEATLPECRQYEPATGRLTDLSEPFRSALRDVWGADFQFGPWVIRTYLVSFDLAGPTLLITSLLDLCVGPFTIAGITLSPTILMLYLYAVVLPLHMLDLLHGAMRRGGLRKEIYDLARRIDTFR